MIQKAVAFATKAHEGFVRKGTNIPYITHPLETAVIVSMMSEDEELIAAALLHDVIEDTAITKEELEENFGTRVFQLVCAESEDKSKSWLERKTSTIEHLQVAGRDEKILTLGDKLSNMRSTARDYLAIGDQIWNRFNEKRKSYQGWYYVSVAKALADMEEFSCYQEYLALCKYVFGNSVEKS